MMWGFSEQIESNVLSMARPACTKKGKSMNGSRRIRSSGWLLLLSALIAICLFSGTVLAGERMPVYVDEYGHMVRSEPGEDPHLRVKEFIQFHEDYSTVTLSESRGGPSPFDPYGDEVLGGKSRLLTGWRILLRMMIDTLQR